MDKIRALPKGYYAVVSDPALAEVGVFEYKSVKYSVTPGENLFSNLNDAYVKACEIPEEMLEGLDYESFSTPVVLMGGGVHLYNKGTPGRRSVVFDHSIAILGEGASINPNMPTATPSEAPTVNPLREGNETELVGSFWWGRLIISGGSPIDKFILDGITLSKMCLEDMREADDVSVYISFRNIIHKSPMFRTLYKIIPPKAESNLHRRVEIKNVRIANMDDADYGYYFMTPAVDELLIDGLVVDTTSQIMGLSNISKDVSNMPLNADCGKIIIRNSYFKNLGGENGICISVPEINGKSFDISVENTVFNNASRLGESPLNIALPCDSVSLRVKDSKFIETRENSASAIHIVGVGENAVFENVECEGFSELQSRTGASDVKAPDFIENKEENWVSKSADSHTVIGEKNRDFTKLSSLYGGRRAYYGDLHVHTNCGGTSDGSYPMSDWPKTMDEIGLDFAAIVDHRQMRGFFLPEWDEEKFIIGTEPGTSFTDLEGVRHGLSACHYNMIFPHKYGLAMVLANFPEYDYKGDELTGFYKAPDFTKERFSQLIKFIQSIGGVIVHAHPKIMMCSDNPLDYYFGEYTHIETLYDKYNSSTSSRDYDLWCQLLALGKRVYASGGSDTHAKVRNDTVSTFYSKEKSGRAFFDIMRSGDYSVGAFGIKMEIDGKPIGSSVIYREGLILNIEVGDLYFVEREAKREYELRVITDKGVAYSSCFSGKLTQRLSLAVEDRAFYRVEIYNVTDGYVIGHSNPIWLDKEEKDINGE